MPLQTEHETTRDKGTMALAMNRLMTRLVREEQLKVNTLHHCNCTFTLVSEGTVR